MFFLGLMVANVTEENFVHRLRLENLLDLVLVIILVGGNSESNQPLEESSFLRSGIDNVLLYDSSILSMNSFLLRSCSCSRRGSIPCTEPGSVSSCVSSSLVVLCR